MTQRQLISSGTPWEQFAGYSRAVRVGDHVFVSGTTASDESGAVQAVGDPYGQTVYILRKIERALAEAGASLRDVVRTRIFVTDMTRWQDVARAHGEIFGDIRPANSLIGISSLVSPDHLVEIEIDALIGSGS